jgi:hypothetical protein
MARANGWWSQRNLNCWSKKGVSGARIFERNGKRQRSIFLLKVELAWLAHMVKELVRVENFEVF